MEELESELEREGERKQIEEDDTGTQGGRDSVYGMSFANQQPQSDTFALAPRLSGGGFEKYRGRNGSDGCSDEDNDSESDEEEDTYHNSSIRTSSVITSHTAIKMSSTDPRPFQYQDPDEERMENECTPYFSLSSHQNVLSPYAGPYTASKVADLTPGNFYLYLPQICPDTSSAVKGCGDVTTHVEVEVEVGSGGGDERNRNMMRTRSNGDRMSIATALSHGNQSSLSPTHPSASVKYPSLPSLPSLPSISSLPSPVKHIPAPPKRTFAEDVCVAALGYGWRHVSCDEHCKLFLQLLSSCRCVSFELLYRRIPVNGCRGGTSYGSHGKSGTSVYRSIAINGVLKGYPSLSQLPRAPAQLLLRPASGHPALFCLHMYCQQYCEQLIINANNTSSPHDLTSSYPHHHLTISPYHLTSSTPQLHPRHITIRQ